MNKYILLNLILGILMLIGSGFFLTRKDLIGLGIPFLLLGLISIFVCLKDLKGERK